MVFKKSQSTIFVITKITKAPRIAVGKSFTSKPFIKWAVSQKINPLITKLNKPRVKILSGHVKIEIIGFIVTDKTPITSATTSAAEKLEIWIPLTIYGSANNASAVINI